MRNLFLLTTILRAKFRQRMRSCGHREHALRHRGWIVPIGAPGLRDPTCDRSAVEGRPGAWDAPVHPMTSRPRVADGRQAWPVGERVPRGLEASWAPRLSSAGVDSGEACRLAVIASGEHVTPGTQVRRRDHAGQWLQSASAAWGLWGWSVAEGGVGSTRREEAPVTVRSSPARAALSRPLSRRPCRPFQHRSRPEVCGPRVGTNLAASPKAGSGSGGVTGGIAAWWRETTSHAWAYPREQGLAASERSRRRGRTVAWPGSIRRPPPRGVRNVRGGCWVGLTPGRTRWSRRRGCLPSRWRVSIPP